MQIDEKIRAQFEKLDELDDNKPVFVVRYWKNELVMKYFTNNGIKIEKIVMWIVVVYSFLQAYRMLQDGYTGTFVFICIYLITLLTLFSRRELKFYKDRVVVKRFIFRLNQLYYSDTQFLRNLNKESLKKDPHTNPKEIIFANIHNNKKIKIQERWIDNDALLSIIAFVEKISGVNVDQNAENVCISPILKKI